MHALGGRRETVDVDVAILGGGCAGLSLATRLAVPGGPRCLVLEARTEYSNEQTWCGWDDGSLAGWGLEADATWTRWSVRQGGSTVDHVSTSQPYSCIRAASFFGTQMSRLEAAENVDVVMGYRASSVQSGGAIIPENACLPTVRARRIVDTRPRKPVPGILLQHFVGWEVETVTNRFDPGRAVLMDFDIDQSGGLQFVYVLPYTESRALVEATVLSKQVWPGAAYEKVLLSYLQTRFGLADDHFTVVRRESGVLPMGPIQPPTDSDTIRIGMAGGALRMSSGYGFHFIQRQADAVAETLLAGTDRGTVVPERRMLIQWMDRIFIDILHRHPDRAPGYFRRMVSGTGADAFARFMMDRGSMADVAAVVASLPKAPFMGAALRVAWRS